MPLVVDAETKMAMSSLVVARKVDLGRTWRCLLLIDIDEVDWRVSKLPTLEIEVMTDVRSIC